jgi:hypothetical protein
MEHRVERVMALDASHPIYQSSLRSLGEFNNSLDARRNLRGEIERQGLVNAREVLGVLHVHV